MLCPLCKSKTNDDDVYCIMCGKKIPRCPVCNRVISKRMRFCMYDGTPLPEEIISMFPDPDTEGTGAVGASAYASRSSPRERQIAVPADNSYRNPDYGPDMYEMSEGQQNYAAANQKRQASGNRLKIGILTVILVLLISLLAGVLIYLLINSNQSSGSRHIDVSSSVSSVSSEQSGKEDAQEDDEAVTSAMPETDPSASLSESEGEPESEEEQKSEEPETNAAEEQDALIYFLTNSDKMYFTREDIEGFDAWSARTACNGIYAQVGWKFNSTEVMNYFLQFDWYVPRLDPEDFSDSMLNEYQKANRDLILNFEKEMGYR